MALEKYNSNYFMESNPWIDLNPNLRDPQKVGYYKTYQHFLSNNTQHAILVLPTGVGKTGLIGLLPYHICRGRVLVITPQTTIRDTIVESLNPENPESFWYERKVFSKVSEAPVLVEYNATKREILDTANFVILNIHKLQERLKQSFLNYLPRDYFDMIIIDEAHHSPAKTWVTAIDYFNKAKVVKLTGTPIRTDGVELAGKLIYKYKLSQAMAKGFVKSLRNSNYIPDELYFTIDDDNEKLYTLNQLYQQDIKDENWVKRTVALSTECSEKVVDASLELLNKKRNISPEIPHKIIAVACSIKHAEQIKKIYEARGFKAEVIHSNKSPEEKDRIYSDIENHRLDIIINVAMLGEGYDHKYLSIAAIFRPFNNSLPYEQFIGRVLRAIPNPNSPEDNIADIISHYNLYLDELWKKYKVEIQESEIIKHLQEENSLDEYPDVDRGQGKTRSITYGTAKENGTGKITEDVYLNTELIKQVKIDEQKELEAIDELKKILKITEEAARKIYNDSQSKETEAIKRPDLYFRDLKKEIDVQIREIIVPDIITKFNLELRDNTLQDCRLFTGQYKWIKKINENGGMLASYFNDYLKNSLGMKRDLWDTKECKIALERLPALKEFVETVIEEYLQLQ
ncbi:DEAD/DEAH box helicase [Lachnotalea glycerini]|uniref:Restriction endonuclease subunit R n=1 Tax=Lachnotalea glycerini TaxID=1763509 RepID=A0A371JBM2_9FIRM|nr:DEAD/DEAH box helicase family protein [Lachnotalea glycerini]RDY30155.1 restriction endonuclease subunit R [Lachnotalea glycerini]